MAGEGHPPPDMDGSRQGKGGMQAVVDEGSSRQAPTAAHRRRRHQETLQDHSREVHIGELSSKSASFS